MAVGRADEEAVTVLAAEDPEVEPVVVELGEETELLDNVPFAPKPAF